ncbi:4Fe-4S dicluster domain-containing protein [Roseiflexus sp. RS-1]|jgi:NADH-quinone oxidoreductase subunit I|uniref:4Fe-4S dicluster domain-containing protein n=1 Tax=Roseiflexus sp. (strain RS-1) TaxID=357808 RepID=UPI0000D8102D|nr:4Fe-4S dicluster domain-containing protein [Roseiflexus sp. RS-1]ABQ91357.1 4Fe-4S ferredoxin, iron-sulfur binding domain protein [Roseiflexus sp. RS-1]
MITETEPETTETQTTRGKVYVIDRGRPKLRAGQGLLTGLDVVFRHFRDALTRKLEKPSQQTGVFTVQYPEERLKLPEAFRNFPILLYDDETGHELCTSCFQCQRICPPQVIHMTQARDPATGKAVPAVAEFLIEYDACMSCGLCAEVCPFDAIKMDHEFEFSTDVHGGLTINKAGLNRPISYYEKIAPTFWAEVKDGAMKKLQGNMKRRPDLIGVAPQMIDTIKAKRAEAAVAQAPAPAPSAPDSAPTDKAARLAAIRAKAAAKDAEAQPAPSDDSAPTDKAARLAAIRAANAARKDEAADVAQTSDTTPDDKAARLAAIRAANAAKKATAEGAPASASAAPAAHAAPTSDTPPAASSTPDDKAARLAAIRAANAAKKAAAEGAPASASAALPTHTAPTSDTPPAASSTPDDKSARLAAIRAANAAKKAAAQKQDGNDDQ